MKPVVLIIRDGWGHNPHPEWNHANAVHLARTPVDAALTARYPTTQIHTSGEDVGLPAGVMGNSEVGHQNIGAGRIVDQEVMRITRAIRDGRFFENAALTKAFDHARATDGSLHILGLISDGRVHSDWTHACSLIDLAVKRGFPGDRVFIHVITDGRDTPPKSGLGFVRSLEGHLRSAGVGRIADVVGRYYAMDRDHRWDRVESAYGLLTGRQTRRFRSVEEAISAYYEAPSEPSRSGDEFVLPSVVAPGGEPDPRQVVRAGDSVIFFNFRGDRPRELTKAFVLPDRDWGSIQGGGFSRGHRIEDLFFVTMTGYEKGLPVCVAFQKPPAIERILGAYLSTLGLRQFRCAETEKYAHVTFFFNDYRDEPFPGEERQIVPSVRDVSTYDQKPEMSAYGVTGQVVGRIASRVDHLVVVNFANPDMVGHTGSLPAAIRAVETVDQCVGRVIKAILDRGGSSIVAADHGNCEQMIDPETGGPHTAHTTYDVDLIVVDESSRGKPLRNGGRLADIAPTLLQLMGLDKPAEMTGESLLEN